MVLSLQVKFFCVALPSASPRKAASGSCRDGKHLLFTSKGQLQCDVFHQSSIILLLSKVNHSSPNPNQKVYSTLEQNCFFLHYLLFGVSLTCVIFFVPSIFTQEYRPSENNFNAFSGKNESTTENFLIKAFY